MKRERKATRKPWTMKELKYLKENYGKSSIQALSKKLNRSEIAIYGQATKQGLTRHKNMEFAVYKGEKLLVIGTREEIKEKLGIDKKKLSVLASPSHRARAEKNKNTTMALRLLDIEG